MSLQAAIAVIGTGAWGTTLAVLLARAGQVVTLCARTDAQAQKLHRDRENRLRLPNVPFPETLAVSADWERNVPPAEIVLLVVPAQRMRENVSRLRALASRKALIVSAAKGLEVDSLLRMSQVIGQELPELPKEQIVVLSGPNLAREINQGKPAATVVASPDLNAAALVQQILMMSQFRVYTSTDQIGVELGGALKNVIALAAGMADGLQVGDNAKAALITRGLAEMVRLGAAMGARPITFAGLAGLGDLVATCASPLSRNHFVGEQLGRGRKLEEILDNMPHIAEGVWTTRAASTLADRRGVEMPITREMHRVLFEGGDARRTVMNLMERPPQEEWARLD
jgi:glycerol-3-phosphate dehydrogenase (NAD(P)+)